MKTNEIIVGNLIEALEYVPLYSDKHLEADIKKNGKVVREYVALVSQSTLEKILDVLYDVEAFGIDYSIFDDEEELDSVAPGC